MQAINNLTIINANIPKLIDDCKVLHIDNLTMIDRSFGQTLTGTINDMVLHMNNSIVVQIQFNKVSNAVNDPSNTYLLNIKHYINAIIQNLNDKINLNHEQFLYICHKIHNLYIFRLDLRKKLCLSLMTYLLIMMIL